MRVVNNYHFGYHVERVFDRSCKAHGIKVKKGPFTSCWDREIKSGLHILKIQVKGTRTLSRIKHGSGKMKWAYQVTGVRNVKAKTSYAESGVDFMAIYIAPMNRWHILPAAEAQANRLKITRNPEGRMKRAIERWDYFK